MNQWKKNLYYIYSKIIILGEHNSLNKENNFFLTKISQNKLIKLKWNNYNKLFKLRFIFIKILIVKII